MSKELRQDHDLLHFLPTYPQLKGQSLKLIAKKPRRSEEGHQMTGGDFEEEPDHSPP
jgi:hypothetical protein